MAANVSSTTHRDRTGTAQRPPNTNSQDRLRYAFAGAATLALATIVPAAAHAQMGSGAGVSVGGPAKPLTFGIQETTTYDSDAARSSPTAASLRGLETSDVIYAPSVTVDYATGIGRHGVALRGYFGYDYYQRNSALRREHIDFSAAANTSIGSRCGVGGQVAYNRGQSGLEDLSLVVTDNTIQTYTVSVNESCASSTGLNESVQVQHSAASNSARSLIDFDTTGVSASVGYANRAIGNLSLVASYNQTNYPDAGTLFLGTPTGLEVTSIGVQLSRPIGNRLAGTASISYSSSSSDLGPGALPGRQSTFSGITASASLTYHLGPRIDLSGNVGRSVQATIREDAGFSVNNYANLNANYTVSSRIHANLGASWSREDFRGGGTTAIPTIAPNLVDLKTVSAGVSVKLGRNVGLSGMVQHEESSTDLALFNFKSDRVSLTISSSF